jgi:hypothetical protein
MRGIHLLLRRAFRSGLFRLDRGVAQTIAAFDQFFQALGEACCRSPVDDSVIKAEFAATPSSYLTMAVQEDLLPWIWLPYHAALEVVALLGNRYRASKYASPLLQTMGCHCHALVEEACRCDARGRAKGRTTSQWPHPPPQCALRPHL